MTTTVLGLGPMGAALAQSLLTAGVTTTVWNRSAARTEPLVAAGAVAAPDPASAVAAADLVILCLRDHDAAREVLAALPEDVVAGRTVVNLSSTTPGHARELANWAEQRGIAYLSGAIMVPTPLIGSPEALILYAGDRELLEAHRERLQVLAGIVDHVGEDHGRASLLDGAMLEVFFAGMTAFLHAAALTTAQGVSATTYLPYARSVLEVLAHSMGGLAADVDAGSYPGTEDLLSMDLAAIEHIVATTREAGLDDRLPTLLAQIAQEAVDAGGGADGFSRVIEVLRRDRTPAVSAG